MSSSTFASTLLEEPLRAIVIGNVSENRILLSKGGVRAEVTKLEDEFRAALEMMNQRQRPSWTPAAKIFPARYVIHPRVAAPYCIAVLTGAYMDDYYPERVAQQLLLELEMLVQETVADRGLFNDPLAAGVTMCMKKYQDPAEIDGVLRNLRKVHEVNQQIQENLERVADNHRALEDLQQASSSVAASSNLFASDATRVHRRFWWQNVRMMIAITVIVLLVIAAVVVCCVVEFQPHHKR